MLKIANFEDFPPIFCQLLNFCQGGGVNPCKIFTSVMSTNEPKVVLNPSLHFVKVEARIGHVGD